MSDDILLERAREYARRQPVLPGYRSRRELLAHRSRLVDEYIINRHNDRLADDDHRYDGPRVDPAALDEARQWLRTPPWDPSDDDDD